VRGDIRPYDALTVASPITLFEKSLMLPVSVADEAANPRRADKTRLAISTTLMWVNE
jgi:hypothetical protein